MSFGTSREIQPGQELRTDVCVIGAGAAGLTLACELDASKLDVIVLEAGGFTADHAVEQETFAFDELGVPLRNSIASRGRQYGGSTGLWFGRVTPPSPLDMQHRPWVPNSGWPLSLAELDPWLAKAADRLHVAFPDKLSIDAWDQSPEIESLRSSSLSDLEVFLWAQEPNVGRSSRRRLEASANVSVITDAAVTELVVDDADRIESVRVTGAGSNAFSVSARHVVLAAGGLENPRLLLASNGRHTNGVGNQHDNVGRYYLDHPRSEGLARVDARSLSKRQLATLRLLHERADGPYGASQLRVVFDEALQRSEELLNHSAHGHLVSEGEQSVGHNRYIQFRERLRTRRFASARDVLTEATLVAASSPDLGRLAFRRATGRNRPTDFIIVDQLEQVPDRHSRVLVDGRRRDRFGLPRLQLDWKIGESTVASHRRLHEVLRSTLEGCGITSFESALLDDPEFAPDYLDMKHPSGTTRMSSSPQHGVVDSQGSVYGTKNLYVLGSSTFPTIGHFNPTLTIVALATRLAHRLRASGED